MYWTNNILIITLFIGAKIAIVNPQKRLSEGNEAGDEEVDLKKPKLQEADKEDKVLEPAVTTE